MPGIAEKIFDKIIKTHFDRPIMSGLLRGLYVEHMVADALGDEFKLVSGDLNGWDMESADGAFRLEIKQSAALQPKTGQVKEDGQTFAPSEGSFNIGPRTAFYADNGAKYVKKEGRYADAYILAWHGEDDREKADQRRPQEWVFYVVSTKLLPPGQQSISRTSIEANLGVAACSRSQLRERVERLVVKPPPRVVEFLALSEALRKHYMALYAEYERDSKLLKRVPEAFDIWYVRRRRDDERIESA